MKQSNESWRVFRFTFTAQKKKRKVAVASTDREEARALIAASFRGASDIHEMRGNK
jgi:hypothetical protein